MVGPYPRRRSTGTEALPRAHPSADRHQCDTRCSPSPRSRGLPCVHQEGVDGVPRQAQRLELFLAAPDAACRPQDRASRAGRRQSDIDGGVGAGDAEIAVELPAPFFFSWRDGTGGTDPTEPNAGRDVPDGQQEAQPVNRAGAGRGDIWPLWVVRSNTRPTARVLYRRTTPGTRQGLGRRRKTNVPFKQQVNMDVYLLDHPRVAPESAQ